MRLKWWLMMSERFYIHCADDINKQLFDTESDFNIHIDEIYSDEELIQLCNLLNYLNDENKELKKENDNCRNDYRELFSNYISLEEENEWLKQKLENLDLNMKNNTVKMKITKSIIGVMNDVLYESGH